MEKALADFDAKAQADRSKKVKDLRGRAEPAAGTVDGPRPKIQGAFVLMDVKTGRGPRHDRRPRLDLQPRHAGQAPARLDVQAVRLGGRAATRG